jgi:hypothetical protein
LIDAAVRRRFNVEDYEGDEVLNCIVSDEIEKADALINTLYMYKDKLSVRLISIADNVYVKGKICEKSCRQ